MTLYQRILFMIKHVNVCIKCHFVSNIIDPLLSMNVYATIVVYLSEHALLSAFSFHNLTSTL